MICFKPRWISQHTSIFGKAGVLLLLSLVVLMHVRPASAQGVGGGSGGIQLSPSNTSSMGRNSRVTARPDLPPATVRRKRVLAARPNLPPATLRRKRFWSNGPKCNAGHAQKKEGVG